MGDARLSAPATVPESHVHVPPTITVTLDHLSFPHIMDAIYESAPRAALLSLRAASRAHKSRADALLATHVVMSITQDPDSDKTFVSFSGRRGSRIPSLCEHSTPRLWWKVKHQGVLPLVLSSARVIDVDAWGPLHHVYSSLVAVPRVSTVRSLHVDVTQTRSDIKSPVSHFIAFSSQRRNPYKLVENPGFPPLRADYVTVVPFVPNGTRRAVLNLQLDVRDPYMFFDGWDQSLPPTLEEMTIIFTPIHGPRATPDPPQDHQEEEVGYSSRWRIIRYLLATYAPTVRFTVVGTTGLHSNVLVGPGFPPNVFQEVGERPFSDYMVLSLYGAARLLNIQSTTTSEILKDNIEWLTHEQYRERTDPEQWNLAMIR